MPFLCANCGHDWFPEDYWQQPGQRVICPQCRTEYESEYEIYDDGDNADVWLGPECPRKRARRSGPSESAGPLEGDKR